MSTLDTPLTDVGKRLATDHKTVRSPNPPADIERYQDPSAEFQSSPSFPTDQSHLRQADQMNEGPVPTTTVTRTSDGIGAIHSLYRRVHKSIHFERGYNFPLFIILVGALMGFTLARFQYLSIDRIFLPRTIPTDALHFNHPGIKRTAIIAHLATVLPASFLACFQFIPLLRHKIPLFHRMNGHVVITLLLTSSVFAAMLIPSSASGAAATQLAFGVLVAATTIAVILAYINIKRKNIPQHRAWMLRTWVYTGSIISERLIMMAAQNVITNYYPDRYSDVMTCQTIFDLYKFYGVPDQGNPTPGLYPACRGLEGVGMEGVKVVVAAVGNGRPECQAALIAVTFGMAMWCALLLHAVGVEVYLGLEKK